MSRRVRSVDDDDYVLVQLLDLPGDFGDGVQDGGEAADVVKHHHADGRVGLAGLECKIVFELVCVRTVFLLQAQDLWKSWDCLPHKDRFASLESQLRCSHSLTPYSEVTRPSTNHTQCCLTSVVEWYNTVDPVPKIRKCDKAHREARFNAHDLSGRALVHIFENWRRWYAKETPMGAVSIFMWELVLPT